MNSTNDLRTPLLEKEADPKEYDRLEILKKIFQLSIYPIIGMIFQTSHYSINTILLGQSGANSNILLAALGLGSLTTSSVVFAIAYTFNGSLSTLISQAYGQKDYRLCSIYLNRQVILNILLYIPLSIILFFSREIYIAMGMDEMIAQLAAEYVNIIMMSHLFLNVNTCYTRYLASQREVKFGMISNILSTIIYLPIAYYLAITQDMQLRGLAIATSINQFLKLAILLLFIRFSRFNSQMISLLDRDSFINLWPQFKMSVMSGSMGIWAWWAFDMFTFIATFMSVNVLAAQTVCRNIVLVFYMIPLGLSQGSSVIVGNSIGAKNLKLAHLNTQMSMVTSAIWGFLCVFVMLLFEQSIIGMFSSSLEVNELIRQTFLILNYYVLIETLQTVSSGIITGIGKQGKASIYTLIGFWILGIPFSLIYVFIYDGGIVGIWLGSSIAMTFNFICYQVMVNRTDYNLVIEEAENRRKRENRLPN